MTIINVGNYQYFMVRLMKCKVWEFPGGLVVRTLDFHCREHGSIPSQGTKILLCSQKKKRKKKRLWKPLSCFTFQLGMRWHNKLSNQAHYTTYYNMERKKDQFEGVREKSGQALQGLRIGGHWTWKSGACSGHRHWQLLTHSNVSGLVFLSLMKSIARIVILKLWSLETLDSLRGPGTKFQHSNNDLCLLAIEPFNHTQTSVSQTGILRNNLGWSEFSSLWNINRF